MTTRSSAVFLALTLISSSLYAQQTTRTDQARPSQTSAESRLQDRSFQSGSLGRSMKYRVLLPQGYFESDRYYPVLYLLHGWGGDYQNWTTLTNLVQYAQHLPVMIVMPDAGNSWYTDSATAPLDKFEQYIIHDVIDDVDQHWRTLRSAHYRAIAGISMGGYAALKLALKYPQMFEVAASMSGAVNATAPELQASNSGLRPSLEQAFGAVNSKTREENDLYGLAMDTQAKSVPYLYLDCGEQDSTFLEPNRKLTSILSDRGLKYEYHEYPGSHNWQYWDARLPEVLNLVVRSVAGHSSFAAVAN